jgi:hypothetical protein
MMVSLKSTLSNKLPMSEVIRTKSLIAINKVEEESEDSAEKQETLEQECVENE